ncbi:2',5'-phosphodiesterase 12 [Chelonus insularis]|uniref:2',5'-phosphodiesterase 12 n=1 Tax=Chelonus insularis TaxID=460826 RepID=UPI00158BDB9A|nr:2',5'-phosphodiesterase 12 [Chelonus insularis]
MKSCFTAIFSKRYIQKIYSATLPLGINNLFYSTHKTRINMNEAFLRYEKGQETFNFSFRYINKELKIDKQFNLYRKSCENVYTFLERIDRNIDKVVNKKNHRSKKKIKIKQNDEKIQEEKEDEDKNLVNNVESGNIVLLKENTKVNLEDTCINVFDNPYNLSMVILGEPYTIKYNTPWILRIKLPATILVGFPVYPSEFETLYLDKDKSSFIWYKFKHNYPHEEIQVGEGFIYYPSDTDIGFILKLKCLPRNDHGEGPEIEVISKVAVTAGPGVCPFEARQSSTSTKLSGDNFRMLSYNILANTYAKSNYSKEVLFPYCPEHALDIDYRKLLIIKELIGYNADIICLQEVDRRVYEHDMKPPFILLDYDGIYGSKGETGEGLLIMYNNKRFQMIENKTIVMSENINSNPTFEEVWKTITNEDAKKRFQDRNTSMLVVVIRSIDNPSEILVIGNTHLYFHPDADHIRLLQAFFALSTCQNFAEKIRKEFPQHNITLLLAGDFNSTPKDGVYKLMTTGNISKDEVDWNSNEQQTIKDVSLSHSLSLGSACGTPQYTNFTVDFADCLDYIFYETNKLEVKRIAPMPTEEVLKAHGAIPSVVFPSDHIAICADLKWKSN